MGEKEELDGLALGMLGGPDNFVLRTFSVPKMKSDLTPKMAGPRGLASEGVRIQKLGKKRRKVEEGPGRITKRRK